MEMRAKKKYQLWMLPIVAVVALVPSQWNTARAIPISFSFTGTGTGNSTSFSLVGSGTVTPYGATTITVTGNGSGGMGSFSNSFVVTFQDGSTLSATSIVTPNSLTSISGEATITGGTGIFAGAAGSYTYVTTAPFTQSTFNFTSTGSGTIIIGSGKVVVPGAWTNNSGTDDPLPVVSNFSHHVQELVGPEQFGSGMLLLDQIAFRSFPGAGPLNSTISNLTISLSTSPLFPNTDNGRMLMSTTYASNVGPNDNMVVYSGPASLTSLGCAGPSPCPFDMVITFSTPFFYDPAFGSLLVDLQYSGETTTEGSLDDALFPLPPGGAVAIVSGASNTDTGTFEPMGHILQFGYTGCTYFLNSGGQSFTSAGGSVNVNVSTPAKCPWSVSGVPNWVTPSATSGTGSTTLTFQAAANAGTAQAATLNVAGLNFVIQEEAASVPGLNLIGSMAHIAAEENWTTSFTLVNKGFTAATTLLNFFGDASDPSGNGPLTLGLVFPQRPIGSDRINAATLENVGLPPNALEIATTEVKPAPTSIIGSAQVLAAGAVDGFAIFQLIPGAQEAVIPLETINASSYLLGFDNTNNVVLSVAVANVSAQAANIPVVIRDENGISIGPLGASISLVGNGHTSFVLSDPVLGFPVTAGIRGTVEFETPAGGQISVLGARTTPLGATKTLTTIPPLANVGTNGGSFPFVASGGDGWQITFVLINAGTTTAPATLSFFDPTGSPMPMPVAYPQTGDYTFTMTPSVAQMIQG